jgi:hypothetical protein
MRTDRSARRSARPSRRRWVAARTAHRALWPRPVLLPPLSLAGHSRARGSGQAAAAAGRCPPLAGPGCGSSSGEDAGVNRLAGRPWPATGAATSGTTASAGSARLSGHWSWVQPLQPEPSDRFQSTLDCRIPCRRHMNTARCSHRTQQTSTATRSAGNRSDRLPPTSDLPQRPPTTTPPGVRIEGTSALAQSGASTPGRRPVI